jgi:hypothetical protein
MFKSLSMHNVKKKIEKINELKKERYIIFLGVFPTFFKNIG